MSSENRIRKGTLVAYSLHEGGGNGKDTIGFVLDDGTQSEEVKAFRVKPYFPYHDESDLFTRNVPEEELMPLAQDADSENAPKKIAEAALFFTRQTDALREGLEGDPGDDCRYLFSGG